MLCRTQWRAGFSGVYALDMAAVIEAAKCFGIATDRTFLLKIAAFEEEVLKALRKADSKGPCGPEKRKECEAIFGKEFIEWACKNCKEPKDRGDG